MDHFSFTADFSFSLCRTISDCFGNVYEIVKMTGNGFCGFNSLSYCLTGSENYFEDVIDDCLNVFVNLPELFRTRTNFGAARGSSLQLYDYRSYMHEAVNRVRSGLGIHSPEWWDIDSPAWCEDRHFMAISLLYDIAVLSYSPITKQWHVFNVDVARG